ncbi:MAG: hypothetical protein COB77_00925 [Gammaproteobacteria bacterium]|nr:MAG: hypothetical protein COB77_00925 [Gammaproteobacteria bacterium]
MSYILDALKKSEQRRGHGEIPNVQTIHSSSLNYREEKKSYWPYVLITAIILNLIVVIYFIFYKEEKPVIITAHHSEQATTKTLAVAIEKQITAPANNPVKTAATIDTIDNNTVDENRIKTPHTTQHNTKKTRNDIDPRPASYQQETVEYFDLPKAMQQQIPTITISAHIYSTNPLQRSIVINNKLLEEGDHIMDELSLHEITKDGAVFDFRQTRFYLAVVSGWQ